jgi:hypothetical protein
MPVRQRCPTAMEDRSGDDNLQVGKGGLPPLKVQILSA